MQKYSMKEIATYSLLHREYEYDCEIRIKDNSNLFYGPSYPLTEAERRRIEEVYQKENLEKRFH